jgi:hypothetical protein
MISSIERFIAGLLKGNTAKNLAGKVPVRSVA